MPFSGSATQLKTLIISNMTANLPDAQAIPNLDAFAGALATAIETWILSAGANGIQVTTNPGQTLTGACPAGGGPLAGGVTIGTGTGIGNIV